MRRVAEGISHDAPSLHTLRTGAARIALETSVDDHVEGEYEVVRRTARIPASDGMRATVKLLGCLAGFTTVYSLIARAVGKRFGRPIGALAFALGPASGYVTVHFFERLQRIGGVVEATRLARERRTSLASLRSSRAAVVDAAAELFSVPSSPSGPDPVP
ncbi:MAG TPA: hypothetical protein VGI44_15835 [Acidimicrobiales bacterium]